MNRPWDKLRDTHKKPPMYPGVFFCDGVDTLRVEFVGRYDCQSYEFRVGHEGMGTFCVTPKTARVLAGFFSEFADQIGAKA